MPKLSEAQRLENDTREMILQAQMISRRLSLFGVRSDAPKAPRPSTLAARLLAASNAIHGPF